MKYLAILGLVLLYVTSFSQEERVVNYNDLINKNGLMYYADETKPYTGKCVTNHKGGNIGMGGFFKDGKKNGEWIWWYKNGNKQRYTVYENGRKNGKCIWWYKNGVKKSEIIFDNNRNIRQISWNEKGEKIKNPSFSSFR